MLTDFADGAQGWGPLGEGTATGTGGALTIAPPLAGRRLVRVRAVDR